MGKNYYDPCDQDYCSEYDYYYPETAKADCSCYYPEMKPKTEEVQIKVPKVIGRNKAEELLEITIPFPRGYEAIEVVDVKKEVVLDIVEVVRDRVLINGRLHKNIIYKTKCDYRTKKQCCHDIEFVDGDVRHISVWIPFSMYINVPGACPGDEYQVEFAGVCPDSEVDILLDPLPTCYDDIPRYRKLLEKVVVTVDLKVLRHTQVSLEARDMKDSKYLKHPKYHCGC